ncbi:hypothetical protein C5F64_05895 [Photobacterium damselae subsp. damselae]|nr:hypothetical protein C5F64_05895 [Photobacterium damselae subsp. damselae]
MVARYQFFCIPNTNRAKFTFVDMGSETFLEEKKQLLESGFEVEDDVIYASSKQEAIELFKSNYLYHLKEFNDASPVIGVYTFVSEIAKLHISIFRKKR